MSLHKTIILHWTGPFKYEDLENNPDLRCGVYLATGKLKYKQTKEIQYCGITEQKFICRIKNHHKVFEINREQEFWLAEMVYPVSCSRTLLELAESIIIYFWQPALNERKKICQPRPVTLLNYWFTKEGKPRMRQHTMCKDLDDVLSWDGKLWRTGNLSVWEEWI
jgi:hypothetical protein